MSIARWTAVVAMAATPMAADAEPVSLYAPGSQRSALGEVAEAFASDHGVEVAPSFCPSG